MNKSKLSLITAYFLWLLNWLTVNGTFRNFVIYLGKEPNSYTRGFSDIWNIVAALTVAISLFFCEHQIFPVWLVWYRCGAIIVSQGCVLVNTDYYVYNKTPHGKNDSLRWLLVGLLNYAEVILWFAVVYRVYADNFYSGNYSDKIVSLSSSWGCLYYSIVTITTLGYGDIRPIDDFGAKLVTLELSIGIFMTLVVLARFVGLVTNLPTNIEAKK